MRMHQGFSTLILLTLVTAVALIGLSIFLMSRNSTAVGIINPTSSQIPVGDFEETVPTVSSDTSKSTTPEIVGRGENLACEWKIQVDDPEYPFTTGTLWTSGKQGRSYVNLLLNGVPVEANVIYKETTAYSWMINTGTKAGFKFTQAQLDDANFRMTPEQRQQADQIRQDLEFNCQPWTPDASKFVIPKDVFFRTVY